MILDLPWLVLPLILCSAVACLASFSAWNRNYIRGNRAFSVFMAAIAWWGFVYALELTWREESIKLILAKLQYLAIPTTLAVLFVFVAYVSGFSIQKDRRFLALLFSVPVVVNVALWVDQPLIWSAVKLVSVGNTLQYDFEYGPLFLVNVIFNYVLFVVVFFGILRVAFVSPRLKRRDGIVLGIGTLVPILSNVLYLLRPDFTPGLDLTPLALLTFGLATAWALFEFRPNDIMPVVYRASFDSLPDATLTLDAFDRVRTVNAAGEQLFATSAADMNGRRVGNYLPDDWLDLIRSIEEYQTVSQEVSHTIDDELRHFDLRVTPIIDSKNQFQGRVIVIRDITVRVQAVNDLAQREQMLSVAVNERTSELQASNAELVRAVRLKDEFLANMSHELRTPLSAVIGTAEAMRSEVYGPITQDHNKPLLRIEDSANHLLALINDILNVAKIEAGQFTLRVSPVSVFEICNACTNLMRSEAEAKDIAILSSFEVQQPTIVVDERRLRQVLINLLSNAVKFTDQGGRVGVTVRDNIEAQQTQFVVWDTGIGIAEDDQDRIFEPFIQADSSLAREYDGTGLGLALTKGLVGMHGGTIDLLSEPGVGSRFTVSMPWDCRMTANAPYEETNTRVVGTVL